AAQRGTRDTLRRARHARPDTWPIRDSPWHGERDSVTSGQRLHVHRRAGLREGATLDVRAGAVRATRAAAIGTRPACRRATHDADDAPYVHEDGRDWRDAACVSGPFS